MFGAEGPEVGAWLASCQESLGRYFALEDPTRLEPAERELYVETLLESRLLLRGFVDRLDVAPTGEIRVVDYKTGKAPHEAYEAKALFQMKFYALVLWRTRGVIPRDAAADLPRQRRGAALLPRRARPAGHRAQGRGAVEGDRTAQETGDWRPRKSPLCDWCAHQSDLPRAGAALPRRSPSPGARSRQLHRRRWRPEDTD